MGRKSKKSSGWYLDPDSPSEHPDLFDPDSPSEHPDLIDPDSPSEHPDLIDPDSPSEHPDLIDPSGYRRSRRRRKNAALGADSPPGRPGSVGTSVKNEYSGALVIRLAPEHAYQPYGTLQELAERAGLTSLSKVLKDNALVSSPRLVRGLEEELDPEAGAGSARAPRPPKKQPFVEEGPFPKLRELERKASDNGMAPLHSLAAYWRVDINAKPRKERRKFLRRLNDLAEVDHAYRELAATDPAYGADPFLGSQGYLDRAPDGIDARWAEQMVGHPSRVGAGVKLVDLEQGWIVAHPDLAWKRLGKPIFGDDRHVDDADYTGNHGTAVLGEIVAGSNGSGVVGIAPGARVGLASHWDSDTGTNGHVADAVYAAVRTPLGSGDQPELNAGDVLLIEVQRSYLPAEVDDADFDAIRLASGLGVIVVEAAGNGGRDLDAYPPKKEKKKKKPRGARIFNRRSGGFRESGAIMVGAALSARPHNRKRASNYGSRIDCYGWGNRVVTCGYGDLGGDGDPLGYTADFTNTSAAAPIIAGAALAVQGMYKNAAAGQHLMPAQMRALLADPATGTRQGRGVGGRIGVMPNLRAVVKEGLGIVPDVYLRDDVGDTGAVPVTGRICNSPDILVSRKPVADFGEGSGTENSLTAGYKAIAKEDNYVFVRMRNRGRGDSAKVAASVYWSEAATLVTPDRWHEIGCTSIARVGQGDTLEVADPIRWLGNKVPAPGYYCLVALLEDTGDPVPLPPGLLAAEGARKRPFKRQRSTGRIPPLPPDFDWYAFLGYLRKHPNIAWRNFHVVDDVPVQKSDVRKLDFLVTGTPAGDRGRFFDLEILQRLPKGAELWFDAPMTLAPALAVGGSWKRETVGNMLRFRLPPLARVPFFGVPLAARAEHRCHFTVHGAQGMKPGGHSVAIRQLFGGQEVGRVTWQFHRK